MEQPNECTICGTDVSNMRVIISAKMFADRRVDERWEKIYNSDVINNEFLCFDCFDIFVQQLVSFKEEKTPNVRTQ